MVSRRRHGNSRQSDPAVLVALLACITVCSSQDFTTNPQNATVNVRDDLTLQCVTIPGLAGQAVLWKRGAVLLFPLSLYPTYTTDGDASAGDYSLTIRNVSLTEDNSWSCQVSGIESSSAYVTVIAPLTDADFRVNNQSPVNLTKGERLVLVADASYVNPPAEIAWFIKSTPQSPAVPVDPSYVISPSPVRSGDPSGKLWNTTSTLSMAVQSKDNGAVIICQASHISLSSPIEISRTLDVRYQPVFHSITIIITGNLTKITHDIIDGKLTVEVNVTGNPEPVITWYRNGTLANTGPSLELDYSMTGNYSCLAKNDVGEVSCGTFTFDGTVWKLILTLVFPAGGVAVVVVGGVVYRKKKGQTLNVETSNVQVKVDSDGKGDTSHPASPVHGNNTSKSDVVFMIREGQSHQPSKFKLDPIVYDKQNPAEKKRKKKKKRKKLNEIHASDEDGKPAED